MLGNCFFRIHGTTGIKAAGRRDHNELIRASPSIDFKQSQSNRSNHEAQAFGIRKARLKAFSNV